jgi:uncharacterized protein
LNEPRKEKAETLYNRIAIKVAALALLIMVAGAAPAQDRKEKADRLSQGQDGIDAKDEFGRTALMRAVERGDIPELFFLFGQQADVNAKTHSGVTAIMNAAGMGRVEILNMLVEKGADIDAAAEGGYTPLMSAALNGQTHAVIILLEKGANFKAKDNNGRTALSYALEKEHEEIIRLLEKAEAESNQ